MCKRGMLCCNTNYKNNRKKTHFSTILSYNPQISVIEYNNQWCNAIVLQGFRKRKAYKKQKGGTLCCFYVCYPFFFLSF